MNASRHRTLAAMAFVVVAAGVVGAGIADAVGRTSTSSQQYGGLPSYLPTSALHPDSTLTGSAARPALTSEGDSVQVRLPGGSALATVSGPVVPGEGLPYQPAATTATWTVAMRGLTGAVPISPRAFSAVDRMGKIYHLGFVPGQPRPPAVVHRGQQVSFELRAVMAVGEGMIRWAPVHRDLVGMWDFVVEDD